VRSIYALAFIHNLALTYLELGRLKKAEELALEVVEKGKGINIRRTHIHSVA
jgi:hypothetical protein